MFKHLTLRKLNMLLLGSVSAAGVCLSLTAIYLVWQVSLLSNDWEHYQLIRSDEARVESVLRSSLGYGGLVHNFQNYILRQDSETFAETQADIGAAMAAIQQYRVLQLAPPEKRALTDIEETIVQYQEALIRSNTRIALGNVTPEELDAEIQIDDSPALRGLNTLRREVFEQSGHEFGAIVKGRVASDIRADFGYGGLIHNFKNLVLSRDVSLVANVRNDIQKTRTTLANFRSLDSSPPEKLALDDIEKVITQYEDRVATITSLIRQGASVATIDSAAKVDDSLAIRGLNTLDQEIATRIHDNSILASAKLKLLVKVLPWLSAFMLGSILLMFIFSSWLFNRRVFGPVANVTKIMGHLAKGETDIEIEHTDLQNEVGAMNRALVTFKEYIIYKKRMVDEADQRAATDELTGLENRKRFRERLEENLEMAKRSGNQIAVLMIDLDHFKPVNDTHGHLLGDEVLKIVAQRMNGVARVTDFPARLGGDEFALLITHIDDPIAAQIPAQRLLDQLHLPMYIENKKIQIGGSIGIALFPRDADNSNELVKRADSALYAAKNHQRGTWADYASLEPSSGQGELSSDENDPSSNESETPADDSQTSGAKPSHLRLTPREG